MSWALVIGVAVGAAFVVIRRARGERLRWVVASAILASPALGLILPRAESFPDGVPIITPRGIYLGSEACVACHPNEYASWHKTFHRTMTQVARGQALLIPVGDHQANVQGKTVRLSHRSGKLFASLSENEPEVEVVLTTGSHHYQAYWTKGSREGELIALPVIWHLEAKRLIPRHDVFLQPPHGRDVSARWNSNCLACHATAAQPKHDESSDTFSTEAVELGIACEACHGPGASHAAHYRDPMQRFVANGDSRPARHIINPAKVDKARSTEICGQCHSYAFPKDPDAWWSTGYTRSYKAGDDLSRSRVLLGFHNGSSSGFQIEAPADSLFWADGTIRVGGREHNGLTASACFSRGEGESRIACVDCHSLHDSKPADQLSKDGESGASCESCHNDKVTAEHTHHASGSIGSSCYGCHMPRISYALYRAQRSHRIDSPSVSTYIETGRPPACNLCHVDKNVKWTQMVLRDTFGIQRETGEVHDDELALVVRMALRGDAAERAIAADLLLSSDAVAAAGSGFQGPILATLLDDPYAAVRFIAARSLVERGLLSEGEYDFLAPEEERRRARELVWSRAPNWRGISRPELLMVDGKVDMPRLLQELALRDNRPVTIAE